MTYPRVRLFNRIFAPLLPTALVLGLVLAGTMIDRPGALAAAETAKSQPGVPATTETAPPGAARPPRRSPGHPAGGSRAPPPRRQSRGLRPSRPPLPRRPQQQRRRLLAKTKKAAKGKKGAKTPKWQQAAPPGKIAPPGKYNAGEDPEFAKQHGWPVKTPPVLPGSILPGKRIVAYYGNQRPKRWGRWASTPRTRCCGA